MNRRQLFNCFHYIRSEYNCLDLVTDNHAIGNNIINFSTPYSWDGVSNIVIDVTHGGADLINNARTSYTTTTLNMQAYSYDGNSVATLTLNRLNVIFGGQVGSNVTNTLSWSWEPGTLTGSSVTVNPTITTTYTVHALNNTTGCSAEQQVIVTVNEIHQFSKYFWFRPVWNRNTYSFRNI